MKKSNEEIDQLIKDALSKEEASYYDKLDEQSVPEMLVGLYKGKLAWMAVMTAVFIFVFFALSVYCAIQFFQTDDVVMMLKWGAGGFFGLLTTSLLKLWNWMQMDKNSMMRELKKLEFQISVLANKIQEK